MYPLIFLFGVRFQQNGIYFNGKTEQNQRGRKAYSSPTVYFRVEHIGIVAAATRHQNKAQRNKGNPDEHKLVVFSAENEFGFGFFLSFLFAHNFIVSGFRFFEYKKFNLIIKIISAQIQKPLRCNKGADPRNDYSHKKDKNKKYRQ